MDEPRRACVDCGTPEVRQADRVNLDPVTSRCLECLVKAAKGKTLMFQPAEVRDWQKAAAADVED